MANKKAAIKYIKITKRNRKRNLGVKTQLKKLLKKAETAIKGAQADAMEAVKNAIAALDRAVSRGIIHRNKAARKKSRLIKKTKKK